TSKPAQPRRCGPPNRNFGTPQATGARRCVASRHASSARERQGPREDTLPIDHAPATTPSSRATTTTSARCRLGERRPTRIEPAQSHVLHRLTHQMRELGDRPHTQTPPREPQGSRKTTRVAVKPGRKAFPPTGPT